MVSSTRWGLVPKSATKKRTEQWGGSENFEAEFNSWGGGIRKTTSDQGGVESWGIA